jgi:hypothetical protein
VDDLTILQLQKNIIKVLQEYRDFLGSDPESELQQKVVMSIIITTFCWKLAGTKIKGFMAALFISILLIIKSGYNKMAQK